MAKTLSYRRKVLFGNEAFEIVECEWDQQSVSALHGHGWSHCVVLVQEGVFENRAEFGIKTEISIFEPGQMIVTPPGVEHEIRCRSEKGKTLHVYIPRIECSDSLRFSSGSLSEIRAALNVSLGDDSLRWAELEKIFSAISNQSISTGSPLFMNQLFSGYLPEALAAAQLIARHKTTMATFEASPAFTAIEMEVVEKLGGLIGWAAGSREGIGVPGGSAANLMALHCARQKKFPDIRKHGSRGEKFQVICSKNAHYSVKKACLVTGVGTDSIVEVCTDSAGRMAPHELRVLVKASAASGDIPLIVYATAGTTVHGAFDPILEIAEICREYGIWLHVDAAWGGPALFSKSARALVQGIEMADSVTFDAHKLFGAGLTSSFFLTRQKGILLEANDVAGGGYIFHAEDEIQDRGRLSWQCGRAPDALSFWAIWKSLGTKGLGDFVDRLFSLREESLSWIRLQPRLELVGTPSYLNICVRVKAPSEVADPDWSKKVRQKLIQENFAMVNFSADERGTFLRLILANPRLELCHLKQILERALALA